MTIWDAFIDAPSSLTPALMNACSQQPPTTSQGRDHHPWSPPMVPPSLPSARRPWTSPSPLATTSHSRSGSPRSDGRSWARTFSSITGSSSTCRTAGWSTPRPDLSSDAQQPGQQFLARTGHPEDLTGPSCCNFRTSLSSNSPGKSATRSVTPSRPVDHRSMRGHAVWMGTSSPQQGRNSDAWRTWGLSNARIPPGHHRFMLSPNLMAPFSHRPGKGVPPDPNLSLIHI